MTKVPEEAPETEKVRAESNGREDETRCLEGAE